MRRIVCLLALLLVFAFGWSQTMTIHFKNGNTQKYNMGEIESIEFSQDKNDVIDNVSIVGVWECTYYELDTDYPEMFDESAMQIGDRVCFKSDGTYYTEYKVQNNETGRWSLNGNTLTVAVDASISIPFDYKIQKLTLTELEFTFDMGIMKLFYRCKRVS